MPSSSRIWIGQYDFDLADIQAPHTIEQLAIGPVGNIDFTMSTWISGMQGIEQGIEYRKGLNTYISSKGADAAFPGQVICQPVATTISVGSGPALGSVLKQIDFTASGGSISTFLIENQRYQHKLSAANTWTLALDVGTNNVAYDGIVHGSNIAIGSGSAGQYYSPTGLFAGWNTDGTNKAHAYGALGDKLYRAQRPNTVYAATAVNGTWDSGSSIADNSFNINSLGGIEQVLMIGKEDGMYSIDQDGTVVPFTPELRAQANSNFASVRAADPFNGDYYFRTLNGVIEISGGDGTKSRVGLDQLASPDLPTVVVQSMTHDDRYQYALCANTSNDLMILRRSIAGRWHTFYWDGSAGTKQGQHIAVSSVFGYPALFFSYSDGSSTYTVKFIRLSTFPNPLQDTNYRFDTGTTARIRMGRFGSPEAQIVLDQIVIQSRNCTGSLTITPYISADGGAITQFGAAAVSSSPTTTIEPVTAVTANYIDLYFDLATNSATTSPVLVGFSLKGTYRPNYRRLHTFTFTTERGHKDIRGGERTKSPTQTAADLLTTLATNAYITVRDERGATFSGMVDSISRKVIKPIASQEAQEAIQVLIQETTSSTTTGLGAVYDVARYS